MRNDFESNYLAHHGILGQKHGQRNGPPYPLDAEDHSAAEKKAGWRQSLHDRKVKRQRKKALNKARKIRKANLKERRKEEKIARKQIKEEKKFAKEKEKILKSGDAKEILKIKDKLSDQEMQNALNRVRNDLALRDLAAANEKNGFDKIDDIMTKAGKVTNWAKTGIEGYNKFAEVYNSVKAHTKEEQLPVIGKDNIFIQRQNENEKKRADREKDLINKAFTEKMAREKNDWADQLAKQKQQWDDESAQKEREWMEKLLKAGYANVSVKWPK